MYLKLVLRIAGKLFSIFLNVSDLSSGNCRQIPCGNNDLKVILDNLSSGDSTVINMSDAIYIIYILNLNKLNFIYLT